MVDHHVDRPEVEALQGVELTGTNRSEILINYATLSWHLEVLLCTDFNLPDAIGSSYGSPSRRELQKLEKVSGAHGGGVPPVPIPNTAVKPASADDSLAAGPLESRTTPDLVQE